PEETVFEWWEQDKDEPQAPWTALADCLFGGASSEASTWRLAMRLAGFTLDRHSSLAEALASASGARGWAALSPPAGAVPDDDDDDEFALADRAAKQVVEEFLRAAKIARPSATIVPAKAPAKAPTTATTATTATTTTATTAAIAPARAAATAAAAVAPKLEDMD
ncbi:unnamed protein product, partial [Polarella glacialis]